MIEVEHVSKSFGAKRALDDVSFRVRAGAVTGFLGPNGAGKTTTMRVVLGLQAPDDGRARIGGRMYQDIPDPICEVGALIDPEVCDRRRTAVTHLRAFAATHGFGSARVGEVLDAIGLSHAAYAKIGTFSQGMRQRLGLARALLGDPRVLILDEPVNGLDPDGVVWIRTLLRRFADEGRTVFLSSHLMSELALTVDHLIVVDGGRVRADAPLDHFLGAPGAVVRASDPAGLATLLAQSGGHVEPWSERGRLMVHGLTLEQIGDAAAKAGIAVYELRELETSLEDAYFSVLGREPEHEGWAADAH